MHRFANPTRFLVFARPLTPMLFWPGLVLAAAACGWGLLIVPPEQLQGDTVRIMFVHVPAAWLGMAGWTGIALASIVELVWRHPLAGLAARAIAVPGGGFALLCLVTGSLWGRPAWGTWWVWDGRLTSMLILFLLYLAYGALAAAATESTGRSRITALFGVVGWVNVPIVSFSVEWWQSLHQRPSISLSGSTMAPVFLWPLLIATLGFTLMFAGIVLMRMRAELARTRVAARLRRMAGA